MNELLQWGQDLQKEFAGNSDRGAALVAASMLDAYLRILLVRAFTKDADKQTLFEDATAPLQSFSGKIELSFALGLISPREHRNLRLIRKIRNAFAHEVGNVAFARQDIAARCNLLDVPLAMRFPEEIRSDFVTNVEKADIGSIEPAPFDTPRQKYQWAAVHLSHCLSARYQDLDATGHATAKPEYEGPSELLEIGIRAGQRATQRIEGLKLALQEARRKALAAAGGTTPPKEIETAIARREAELKDLQNDPALKILLLAGTLAPRVAALMRRWEAHCKSLSAKEIR